MAVELVAPYLVKGIKNCSIDEAIDYLSKSQSPLAFDTETTGLCPHSSKIVMVQIGDLNRQFVIDARHLTDQGKSLLSSFLEQGNFIGTNLKFDYKMVLSNYGVRMKGNLVDISLQEHVIRCGYISSKVRASLGAMAKRYLGITADKEVRLEFTRIKNAPFNYRQISYGKNDVIYPVQIAEKQQELIDRFNLHNVIDLENKFLKVVAEMEYVGMKVNKDKWVELAKLNEQGLKEFTKKLDEYVVENKHYKFCTPIDMFTGTVNCNIQWSSPSQVAAFLEHLGFDVNVTDKEKSEKYGKTVYKKSVGKEFLSKHSHPFIDLLKVYSKYQKAVSTYGVKWVDENINKLTGRVHTNFRQILNTGRMASSSPNVQQIPSYKSKEKGSYEAHRTCFEPREGYTFVVRDYSNQELRVLAEVSKEPSLIVAFTEGDGDLHSLTASKVFGKPVSKKENAELRQVGKTLNFAMSYGASALKISQSLSVPVPEAQQIINTFFEGFPYLRDYFREGHKFVEHYGYIEIDPITKRRSYFNKFYNWKKLRDYIEDAKKYNAMLLKSLEIDPSRAVTFKTYTKNQSKWVKKYQGDMHRASQNYRIQGLSASMTKVALNKFYDYLHKHDLFDKVSIVLALHDEIVLEAATEVAEKANKVLQHCMESAGKVFCKQVPILSDGGVQESWDH